MMPPRPRRTTADGWALADIATAALRSGAALRFVARGGSMSPWIRDGDEVTIAPLSSPAAPDLRRGDVVAFVHPGSGRLVVHRLLAREGNRWIAAGDRVAAPDGAVEASRILGRLAQLRRRGREIPALQGRTGAALGTATRWASRFRDT